MKTAAFTGSFDPFTRGHHDIVRRALQLFDRVVIGVGHNEHKQYRQTAEERVRTIRSYYAGEPRVAVEAYADLTTDFCRRIGAQFIVKGVRSVHDFEYEREMGEVNRQLTGVETVCLFADPALSHISSSVARELEHFGHDITALLPQPQNPPTE